VVASCLSKIKYTQPELCVERYIELGQLKDRINYIRI